jgi:hypothetical protein
MITETRKPAIRINWLCVQRAFFHAIAFGFTFAAGGWMVSIRDDAARLPYLERATVQNEHVQAVAGPNPLAAIKCLKRQSAAAASVAGQAVVSNYDADVSVPSLSQIPNCPPPPKPAPPSHTGQK